MPAPFIDVHTHQEQAAEDSIIIRSLFPDQLDNLKSSGNLLLASGIHPWYIVEPFMKLQLKEIDDAATNKRIVAIGETGIDHMSDVSLNLQKDVFQHHIDLSEKHKLPLIIHCIKAFPEILEFHKTLNPEMPWIMHGFNGNKQLIKSFIQRGIYLSAGTLLTEKNAKIRKSLKSIPPEQLFLETDNKDINIDAIYQNAAEIRKTDISQLKETIYKNFQLVFKT